MADPNAKLAPSDRNQRPDSAQPPPATSPRKTPAKPPGAPGPSRFSVWRLVLVALGLWNLWAFFPRQNRCCRKRRLAEEQLYSILGPRPAPHSDSTPALATV